MNKPLFVFAGLLLLVGSASAMAVDLHEPERAVSGLLEMMRNSSNQWSASLRGHATTLFWSLVAIDMVLVFGPMVLRSADTGEIIGEIVRFVLTVGFFATLLIYSVTWSEAIVNSFRHAGGEASGFGAAIYPGDMFSLGVELAYTVSDVNTLNPGVAVAVAGSALVILLCFTFIAAFMALTLVESYVVINAGVLFMGFGGSKFTREYSISILRYAFSVGAKLFVLTLLVGIIMQGARDFQAAYQHDNTSMWAMVGLAALCALLSKAVPDMIQALINGVSSGGGGAIGGMAAAGMAFGAGAMAAMQSSMGGGMLGSAGKSVSDLLKSSGIGGGSGGSGGSPMSNMASDGSSPRGPSPRVGGGVGSGASNSSGPAPRAGAAPSSSGSSGASGTSNASPASSSSSPAKPSVSTMAHAAAEIGIRTVGTATAIAMPGADSAATLSTGPPPSPPDFGESDLGDTPENVIRPASDAGSVGEQTESRPVDTMSSLKEALNNRGNTL